MIRPKFISLFLYSVVCNSSLSLYERFQSPLIVGGFKFSLMVGGFESPLMNDGLDSHTVRRANNGLK